MNSQSALTFLFLVAGVIYLPPIFLPLLKLEGYNSRRKLLLHSLISFLFLATAAGTFFFPDFLADKEGCQAFLFSVLALIYLELGVRVGICLLAAFGGARFAQIKTKFIDLACYGDPAETRIQAHPFLQFTGRIGKPAGFQRRNAYGDYGFVNISHSDLAKPRNVTRVACLGGSTTEYGYPALLEEVIGKDPSRKVQVLNFGLSWWTTIHSLVNYVLNVRDFRPDIVVIHHNVNDHKYRGYSTMRGDGAHAFVPWSYRGAPDRYLIHFSVVYRVLRLKVQAIYRWLPKFGDFPEEQDKFSQILQQKGKSFAYKPAELAIFRRNITTILQLAKLDQCSVVLTTMPFSNEGTGELYEAIKAHMVEVNELIRSLATEHSVALVDLAKTSCDEAFFSDMVHMNELGDRKKAQEIGQCILGLWEKGNP